MCGKGNGLIGAFAILYKTCRSTSEYIFRYPFECTALALGCRDLSTIVAKPQGFQLGDHMHMVGQVLVSLDKQRPHLSLVQYAPRAGNDSGFDAVNIKLDVIGYGHHTRSHK